MTLSTQSSTDQHARAPRNHISRPRLFELLDNSSRITLVRAEGGSGKTSLVSDWLESRHDGLTTLWVSLDQNCHSSNSFWHRLVQGILGLDVIPATSPLHRYVAGEAAPSQASSLLIDELNTRRIRLRIVIDDLHHLDQDAQRELASALGRAPQLEFIGTSRTSTALDTGPDALRLGTTSITSADLALTFDELTVLSARLEYRLTPSEVTRLRSVARGNLLASRLSITALGREPSTELPLHERTELLERVAQYMSNDLVPSFSGPEESEAAMRLSLASRVDRAMAEDMTGSAHAWSMVEAFAREGAGHFHYEIGRQLFSFHPLVESALSRRAESALDTGELQRIRRVAVRHLAAWGDPVELIRMVVGAGDYDQVWPYFVRDFSPLSVHRVDDVIRVLDTVPDQTLREHGTMAITFAVMLSERGSRPSSRLLQLVEWGLRYLDRQPPAEDTVQRYLMSTARMAAHRAARHYVEAADASAELAVQFSGLSGTDRARLGPAAFTSHIQVMITEILAGRVDDAVEHSASLIGDQHPGRKRHVASLLAYVGALRGDIPGSRSHLAQIPTDYPSTWPTALNAVGWNFANSLVRLESGNIRGANEALEPLAHRASHFEHWPSLLWTRALIHLADGDVIVGYDELRLSTHNHRGRIASPMSLDRLSAIYADLALAAHDESRAREILEEAPDGAEIRIARARHRLVSGKPGEALDLLLSSRGFPRTPRRFAVTSLIAAAASRQLDLEDEAVRHAKRAAETLRRYELTTPLAYVARGEIDDLLVAQGIDIPAHLGDSFSQRLSNGLTAREVLVLRFLRSDEPVPVIAQRLHVSPNTVKSQIKSIYKKLGVSSRAGAVVFARERGLL